MERKMVEVKTRIKELAVTPFEMMLYTKQHTWAALTPEGNIRVGVTTYAQMLLRGIAHVVTEPVGTQINQMEPFGIAETWMFIFDLYAPISGRIVNINKKLEDEPSLVTEDPYGKGWIVEIKPNTEVFEQELKKLLSAAEYKKIVP